MPGLDQVLMKYREKAFSERDKGDRFERLMKRFLQTYQTIGKIMERKTYDLAAMWKAKPEEVLFHAHYKSPTKRKHL